jgi:tRNA(Ile)-lysidine synthase
VSDAHLSVSRFLAEHHIARDEPLLIAVSGGTDSLALLSLLASLGQRLGVAHVHHGLRGAEADADLAFVRDRAESLGVPFFAAHVDAAVRDGRSPEMRARALRYEALEEIRAREGYRYVLTAHTLDDQAETLLLRAIRGTGLDGLSCILPASEDGYVLRPLLGVRREALRSYLTRRGLAWREDASNRDPGIPRSRLRAEVLPVLEDVHPGAAERLANLAKLAQEARVERESETRSFVDDAVRPEDGGLSIDARRLTRLSPQQRMRVAAELMRNAGLGTRVSTEHLRRIERFIAEAETGKALSLPGDSMLLCDRDHFWLGPDRGPGVPEPFRAELSPPDPLLLPACELRFHWRRGPGAEGLVLPEGWTGAVVIRSPAPGDRLEVEGSPRSRRVKDLFAAARWSNRARARAVVVEECDSIVWVPGLTRPRSLPGGGETSWRLVAEPLSGHSAN